ncbi:hypothetical protein BD770DRAFT_381310 [Pilaira anomala]|nr:hypothetical protein BD770DRAFT_381310 [Pilaira anomala]
MTIIFVKMPIIFVKMPISIGLTVTLVEHTHKKSFKFFKPVTLQFLFSSNFRLNIYSFFNILVVTC